MPSLIYLDSHMKQKRVINFPNIGVLPAFRELPAHYETDEAIYYITQDATQKNVVESTYCMPADLSIISSRPDESLISILPSQYIETFKTLFIPRYTKVVQACLLKTYFEKTRPDIAPNYHHLETYSCDVSGSLPFALPEGKYVIKPSCAARSLAIIRLDTSKLHIREFFKLLDMHIKKICDGGVKVEEDPTDKTLTAKVLEFFDKHNIPVSLGEEYKPDEAVNYIIDRTLIAQEENPFEDVLELRALRCNTATPLIYTRPDLEVGYSGYGEPHQYHHNSETFKEINAVLTDPLFPGLFGSVDLWVEPDSGKWGIYEFQPEYCSINLRDSDHERFLKDAIDSIWEFCLGESK